LAIYAIAIAIGRDGGGDLGQQLPLQGADNNVAAAMNSKNANSANAN